MILRHNVETYVKSCNVYVAFKAVRYKPHNNLQLLSVTMHCWKDLFIDFIKELPIFTNYKGESFDSILVIVNRLTKIVYYQPFKVIINTLSLAKVVIEEVVRHYGLPDSIVNDCKSVFTSKFWTSLY